MVFGGIPRRVETVASLGPTGVDEQSAAVLEYSGGRLAVVSCSLRYTSPQEAHILGTDGRIRVHSAWWHSDTITVSRVGREEETITLPKLGNGYTHEALEVMECLRSGKLESGVMPLDETLQIMQTLDAIRGKWGLK